jgi:hypothetical protein
MRHLRTIGASFLVIVLVWLPLTSFADSTANSLPPETQGTPQGAQLSRADAVRLADDAALKKGYVLSDYLRTKVFYQFLKKDRTWSLLRERVEIVRSRRCFNADARPLKLIVSCLLRRRTAIGVAFAGLGGDCRKESTYDY